MPIICIGVLGYIAFWSFNAYRAGLLSLPDLPSGAYTLSFSTGFRAIVLDADVPDSIGGDSPKYLRSLSVANWERRYLGIPFDVQPWFNDAWSWCKRPTEDENADLDQMPDEFKRTVQNARFEAVCRIDVDGTEVIRGLIFSVPRL
jgi:hypothetical protein